MRTILAWTQGVQKALLCKNTTKYGNRRTQDLRYKIETVKQKIILDNSISRSRSIFVILMNMYLKLQAKIFDERFFIEFTVKILVKIN